MLVHLMEYRMRALGRAGIKEINEIRYSGRPSQNTIKRFSPSRSACLFVVAGELQALPILCDRVGISPKSRSVYLKKISLTGMDIQVSESY